MAVQQVASPFAVGDTVEVIEDVCAGLVGEIRVIDPEEAEGKWYGVQIDGIEGWIFFSDDELKRVENEPVCQICGGLGQVRQYPSGLFSLPAWKWVPCPACSEALPF